MRVQEEADVVQKEIKNTLHTVATNAFLERKFPSHPRSESDILEQLKKNSLYAAGRWTKFPKQPISGQEKLLYLSFATACNSIVDALPDDAVGTKIVYLDRHSTTPHSHDYKLDMAASRPDGAGASPSEKMKELEVRITEHEVPIQSTKRTTRQETEATGKENAAERAARSAKLKELIELYTLWWLQIHVVYEIKNTTAEWYDGLTQLLIYMRQMLIEQLDRRFVVGLLLCFDELTDPKRFIRVLAGLSRMRPEELGWDTSMKIYLPSLDNVASSYDVGPNFQGVYGKSRYHVHWVIDVVVDDKIVKYVTVSIISDIRSAEICGRATVVYEVIEYEKRFNPTETLALKRYWRPLEKDPGLYPPEGKIYDILDKARSTTKPKYIRASHDIEINGKIDSTFEIRHGLKVEPVGHPMDPHPIRNMNDYEHRQYHHSVSCHAHAPAPIPPTPDLVDRCHTNILMPMGEVVRRACSHRELLSCFRDFVTDEAGETFGRLMDYDHAKKAEKASPIPCFEHTTSRGIDALTLFRANMGDEYEVDDAVATEALHRIRNTAGASQYVLDVIETQRLEIRSSKTLCMADLEWDHDDKVEEWADYDDRKHRKGERTGTLPYMSAEVLKRYTILTPPGLKTPPPFVHEVIHDMESFLWVLVHICMTRNGPGIGMRRPELDKNSESFSLDLQDAIVSYFDGGETKLIDTKSYLLRIPETFESAIIAHFDPYFEPLKELVRKWWDILILGYRYRADEYYNIHSHIIRIIDEALGTILGPSTEDTAKELERRKARRQRYLDTFKPRPADPSGTTLPGSPSSPVLTTPPDNRLAPQSRPLLDPESPSSRPAKKRRRL
ncbi:hypothetical protein DXG01_008341 [Tephrocybe rancida]|nr:hypothetical protein DXG01_008341 [Tephrocybe rancida]